MKSRKSIIISISNSNRITSSLTGYFHILPNQLIKKLKKYFKKQNLDLLKTNTAKSKILTYLLKSG